MVLVSNSIKKKKFFVYKNSELVLSSPAIVKTENQLVWLMVRSSLPAAL